MTYFLMTMVVFLLIGVAYLGFDTIRKAEQMGP
jgi:hypothetical protein